MLTHSATLYFAAVLIWGSTWYAITFQLGEVAPEASVAYRFGLASVLLLIYCWARGLRLKFKASQHVAMFFLGVCLFGLNYMMTYWATEVLTSGLIAVLFSTIVLMNILNGRLFFGQNVKRAEIFGATIGLLGISLMFWPEIDGLIASGAWKAVVITLIATYLASLGNLISGRNSRQGLPVLQANAYGMGYGALTLIAWCLVAGIPFSYSFKLDYSLSLLYLSVFGSILAFTSYLTLVGRIGASKAAYATVLFPVVALVISTFFEGYRWNVLSLTGLLLILAGNVLVVSDAKTRSRIFATLKPSPQSTE